MEYPKIQTLFLRDDKGIIIPDKYTLEEFIYLKDNEWECSEKLDGTNMRVEIHCDENDVITHTYNGRTSKAIIPKHLLEKMKLLFDHIDWREIFPTIKPNTHITLYGEGYGKKIQTPGSRYIKDGVNFCLFDVKVDNLWLSRANCVDIAEKLHIDIVPVLGYFTIPQAIDLVANGLKSLMAEDSTLDMEGFVLKTPTGLCNRRGERLITKIKTCDFRKWEAAYGNNPNVKQEVNKHYETI